MSRLKVYLSDEGFGHIMRQRAILMELLRSCPDLEITLQTERQIAYAQDVLPKGIRFLPKFNNILTVKSPAGSLDVERTHQIMASYPELSTRFIAAELEDAEYDFIISDLVPEAFAVSRAAGVPNCGVCHFTWDWFFSMVFSPQDPIVQAMERYLEGIDVLYLPPLTPDGVLERYADKAVEVPFIASYDEREHCANAGRRKVMILDSGTAALSEVIRAVLPRLPKMKDIHFYLPPQFDLKAANVTVIEDVNRIPNVLPDMDLVICRAGFNTISQCMVHRVPMVLVDEVGNPEIRENLRKVTELGLCVTLSIVDYQRHLGAVLRNVFRNDHSRLLTNIRQFKSNGAAIIARQILTRLGVQTQEAGTGRSVLAGSGAE